MTNNRYLAELVGTFGLVFAGLAKADVQPIRINPLVVGACHHIDLLHL